jgi:hypothetical protein
VFLPTRKLLGFFSRNPGAKTPPRLSLFLPGRLLTNDEDRSRRRRELWRLEYALYV